jgi:hypothetical protein
MPPLLKSNSTSTVYGRPTVLVQDLGQVIKSIAKALIRFLDADKVLETTEKSPPVFDESTYYGQAPAAGTTSEENIEDFVLACMERANFSPESAVTALILVNRLRQGARAVGLNRLNWRLVYLTALLLSQKMDDDTPVDNQDFPLIWDFAAHEVEMHESDLSKVNAKAFNKMESKFLELVGYQVHVSLPRSTPDSALNCVPCTAWMRSSPSP